jgi:hypothetical protein
VPLCAEQFREFAAICGKTILLLGRQSCPVKTQRNRLQVRLDLWLRSTTKSGPNMTGEAAHQATAEEVFGWKSVPKYDGNLYRQKKG